MQPRELFPRQTRAVDQLQRRAEPQLVKPLGKVILIPLRRCGQPRKRPLRVGISRRQRRQRRTANPVSRVILAGVGFVLAPRLTDAPQIRAQRLRLRVQQRTNELPPPPAHRAKPADIASPRRVKQHGLRLIPPMMRQRDCVRADGLRRLLKKIVAQRSGRFLKAAPVRPRVTRRVNPPAVKRNVLLFAQRFHKAHVLLRGRAANAMLHMCAGDGNRVCFPNFAEKTKQRRRIRAAADRNQHMTARQNGARAP